MITNSSLHFVLIKEIIENGFAPSNSFLADYFRVTESEIKKALIKLQDYHGVVLHPNEQKVWVVHPFSLAPTNFFLKSEKGQWWGNCAWCSLGVAALLETDLTITTNIGAEGKQVVIRIENGRVIENNYFVHFPIPMKNAWDNVIYTCSNMLFFENVNQIGDWSKRHNITKGDIQPIEKIWEFAKKWYGNHLDPDWEKWTVDQAKEMFAQFQLNHSIWNLDESMERF